MLHLCLNMIQVFQLLVKSLLMLSHQLSILWKQGHRLVLRSHSIPTCSMRVGCSVLVLYVSRCQVWLCITTRQWMHRIRRLRWERWFKLRRRLIVHLAIGTLLRHRLETILLTIAGYFLSCDWLRLNEFQTRRVDRWMLRRMVWRKMSWGYIVTYMGSWPSWNKSLDAWGFWRDKMGGNGRFRSWEYQVRGLLGGIARV